MKRAILTLLVTATGSLTMAQTTTVAGAASTGPAAAPTPVMGSPASGASTNAAKAKPEPIKSASVIAEFSAINKELAAQELKLREEDPEIKALDEKRRAAQQTVTDIATQMRLLVNERLAADPKFAPLLTKRAELLQSVQPAGASGLPPGPPNRKPPVLNNIQPKTAPVQPPAP